MIDDFPPLGLSETSKSLDLEGKSRIRLLPDALVDQIAAGEVVERPASVVKELVENSLDAGADRIRVEVRDGGAALIAVTDDGRGMDPSELALATQRHATSKLRSAEDLERIQSFGFRGEALPAIASVSRFRIFSRARGSEHGFEIRSEGGLPVSERAAGGPEGTRIEVADLFASVPARRKFLKRAGTEWGHISDWLSRLALSRPDIHIEIQRDDRKATIWPACEEPRDRIAALLSDDDAASLLEVDHSEEGLRVHAYLSTPERTRSNGQALYLYVNGRPVRDRLLRHALTSAYRDLLPRGRFPVAVLFLELPPDQVDVNVHPAKWEVRFADPQAVHRAIRHAVKEAMASRRWLSVPLVSSEHLSDEQRIAEREGGSEALLPSDADRYVPKLSGPGSTRTVESGRQRALHLRAGLSSDLKPESKAAADDWIFAAGTEMGTEAVSEGREIAGEGAARSDAPVASFGALQILGQLRASYLLAEGEQGLVVVDQHAAHERILYEKLRASWLENGVARQGLLTPVTVRLSGPSLAALEVGHQLAERLGFEVEAFGEGTVLVRAMPAEMAGQDVSELVRELAAALEELGDAGEDGAGEASAIRWLPSLDKFFATMACHSARRFGDRLPAEEQQAILSGLDTIPWAPTCPHGRPVAILIDHLDLESRFKRR